MSETKDRKSFLDKDYTRRQFLKLSGKSLAGVALSSSLLSVLGVSEKAVADDKVRVWAFPLTRFRYFPPPVRAVSAQCP